jgi:hypothetical protein
VTDAPSTEAGQAEFVVADGDTASQTPRAWPIRVSLLTLERSSSSPPA